MDQFEQDMLEKSGTARSNTPGNEVEVKLNHVDLLFDSFPKASYIIQCILNRRTNFLYRMKLVLKTALASFLEKPSKSKFKLFK